MTAYSTRISENGILFIEHHGKDIAVADMYSHDAVREVVRTANNQGHLVSACRAAKDHLEMMLSAYALDAHGANVLSLIDDALRRIDDHCNDKTVVPFPKGRR